MTNEELIQDMKDHISRGEYEGYALTNEECIQVIQALEQTQWIPIKTRPLTEEEKEEIGHEYAFMYDCSLPDDGQDVLITDCYGNVEVDTFCRDHEGVYFETNCDDGEVIAWRELPQPYKEGDKE